MTGTGILRRAARGGLILVLALAGAALVPGCGSDTLYDADPGDLEPPTLRILEPTSGDQAQAGQALPVHVTAVDPDGIAELTLRLSGAVQATVVRTYSPPRDSVAVDTTFAIPAEATGVLEIRLEARDGLGAVGEGSPVVLTVGATDNTAPTVTLEVESSPRMELDDSVVVQVTARDNPGGSGLQVVGMTAIVVNLETGDTAIVGDMLVVDPPTGESVTARFTFTPTLVDPLELPDTLRIEVFGWARDVASGCGAAVDADPAAKLSCAGLDFGGEVHIVAPRIGARAEIVAVAGRTSAVPGGGTVADLAVDTLRGRVYASNLSRNRLHFLEAASGAWGSDVVVGSQPWGLALNRQGDSIYVANSGGTNISAVSLGGAPREDLNRRFFTPNDALYEITWSTEGGLRHSGTFHDFSDRPQFIAQDSTGKLLYSTKPTPSASDGTIRVVRQEPGWAVPEAQLLVSIDNISFVDKSVALAHVDSVKFTTDFSGVVIFDHIPGTPGARIQSAPLPAVDAAIDIEAQGSDIVWGLGKWVLDEIGLADTTFVAASGDRGWVAFGEGGRVDAGRIVVWNAANEGVSYVVSIADIVSNASEPVRSLELNRDGSLGAARGAAGYFFTNDLRLQGSFADGLENGGAGAALHPEHPAYVEGAPSTLTTLAFVGTGDYTIRIVDTIHFTLRGEIHIRDNVIGPLRSGPPLAGDDPGVVAKLYGVTDAGGVVVVDVLATDILPVN